MNAEIPLAPLAGYEGRVTPRPWEYRVTVCIPHLDTPQQLALALGLWTLQTVRPYLLVVDTGSPVEVCDHLEGLRAADCELHYIRSHGYKHPSAVVTAALDLAQTLCTTEYLLHTHSDVFPRRRDLIEYLLGIAEEGRPVVGWQMSPRNTSTAPSKEEWRSAVSHTCTLLHLPTVHRNGLSWSMQRYFALRPHEDGRSAAWPDTESAFYLSMSRAGLKPHLIGQEKNFERDQNEWWDHARSYPGLKLASRHGALPTALLFARALGYMAEAEREAKERLELWRSPANAEGKG